MAKPKLVVLSGAGISAESGINTFRDANGLWEGHDVMQVASPEGWRQNRELVLEFYNQRRKNVVEAIPNDAHKILVDLEEVFDVQIITQNVDDLHERAGSSNVIHLHGEIRKSRSTVDAKLVYNMEGWELKVGDRCEKGSQLRPHIVWFGEMVPAIEYAIPHVALADKIIIIGTSMVVYPAAGLIDYASQGAEIFVIDPNMPDIRKRPNLTLIEDIGSVGMRKVADFLLN